MQGVLEDAQGHRGDGSSTSILCSSFISYPGPVPQLVLSDAMEDAWRRSCFVRRGRVEPWCMKHHGWHGSEHVAFRGRVTAGCQRGCGGCRDGATDAGESRGRGNTGRESPGISRRHRSRSWAGRWARGRSCPQPWGRPMGRVCSGALGQLSPWWEIWNLGFGPLASGAFRNIPKSVGRRAEPAPAEGWGEHLRCTRIRTVGSKTPLEAGVITV